MSIAELRLRLAQVGKDASGLYEEANTRRKGLERIDCPPTLEEVLAAERAAIRVKIAKETDLTDAERRRVAELRRRQRSWNPIARSLAKSEEQQILKAREQRRDDALRKAQEQFDKNRVPDIQRSHGAHERRYKDYVRASLDYENEMREARETLRQTLPKIFERMEVLERAGVASLEAVSPRADLTGIARSVDAAYRGLPPGTAAAIERDLKRERSRDRERTFDRSR
jgi:G3E family GTPase